MKTRLETMLEMDRLRAIEPGSDFDSFICGAIAALKWALDRNNNTPEPSKDIRRMLEVCRNGVETRRDDEKA